MHFGQIGLEQIWHWSMVSWSGCLGQRCGAPVGAGAGCGVWILTRARGGYWGAGWAGGASDAAADVAAAGPDKPSSCRTSSLTKSDASRPHAGQTNRTGVSVIRSEEHTSELPSLRH